VPDYEQLRHEREQIDAGARALRSRAISDGYAGLERKALSRPSGVVTVAAT
jgi:hypothetical protein